MINEKNYRGNGGIWEVEISNEKIYVNDKEYSQYIIKTGNGNIERNIIAYNAILKTGIPTLSFFNKSIIKGKQCIIAENLNSDENILYVSPNTDGDRNSIIDGTVMRLLINSKKNNTQNIDGNNLAMNNDIDEILQQLRDECKNKVKVPVYEEKLLNNKFPQIINFSCILEILKKDMKTVSAHNIALDDDAFFFGINIKDFSINYKIADFDNIMLNYKNSKKLEKINQSAALSSLYIYIKKYMTESDLKENYISKIQTLKEYFL